MSELVYHKGERVKMTKGPFKGAPGQIIAVRGLFSKTYDVALLHMEDVVLRNRHAHDFEYSK